MRNKIKELMNKEDGFTLVELLAVIVILGIIVAIAVPAIGNVLDNAQTNANAAEVELIEDAAMMYYLAEDSEESIATPDVLQLKADGYLDLDDKRAQALSGLTITPIENEHGRVTSVDVVAP